jgi:sulfonate transport system ATP-binding protein
MNGDSRGCRAELLGVRKSFGALDVLQDIDLATKPGELLAIVGRSGCGKSTVIRLLAGLEAPTAGAVRVDGVTLSARNRTARVMFQEPRLLPWYRVLNNVSLGLSQEQGERAVEALARVGLAHRGGDWPAVLSGGQKQRVALARALASEPRLLLLDEPLGSLDALTRLEMQTLLESVWRDRGFTAVLVTHDVEEAVALADRVLILEAGRIGLCVDVSLPRPRDRSTPMFTTLVGQILRRLSLSERSEKDADAGPPTVLSANVNIS